MRLAAIIRLLSVFIFQIFISIAPLETEIKKECSSDLNIQTENDFIPEILEEYIDIFSLNDIFENGNAHYNLLQATLPHSFIKINRINSLGNQSKLLNFSDLSPPALSKLNSI